MTNAPVEAREEYVYLCQLLDLGMRLDRSECEVLFPNLIAFIKKRISLPTLMLSYGVQLRLISPDSGVLVAVAGCPTCGENVFVREYDDER